MALSRAGWRKVRTGAPSVRAVDVVGMTGAGKSTIGNLVTENNPPPRGQGFKEGRSAESETTQVATLQHDVRLDAPGVPKYTLHWSDTQGVSDTQGRTVDFLDHIVEHMRTNPPNGIVLMYNCGQKDTASVKLSYKAMRFCFNESLPDGRTLLVMNKVQPLDDLLRSFETDEAAEAEWNKVYEQHLDNIRTSLGINSLSNVVPIEMGALSRHRAAPWVKAIQTRIGAFPTTPMDCSRFKTFSEVMQLAISLQNDAVDAVKAAEECIKDIESRIVNITGDIAWHENCIKVSAGGLGTAAAAGGGAMIALGIATFGIGAAVAGAATAATCTALSASLANSRSKLPVLQEELQKNIDQIENIKGDVEGNLEREKAKYREFLAEITEIKDVMDIKVLPPSVVP